MESSTTSVEVDAVQVSESFLELVWISFMDSNWFMKVVILLSSFVALSLLTGNGRQIFSLLEKISPVKFIRTVYYTIKSDNEDIESPFDDIFLIPVTKKTHIYKAPEVLTMNPEEEQLITKNIIDRLVEIHRTSKYPSHMVIDLSATEKIGPSTRELFYTIIDNVENGVILHLTIIFALNPSEQMAELKEELKQKESLSNAKNWEIDTARKNIFMDSK